MADHVCRCVMLPGVGTPRAYVTLVFAGCRIESENGLLPTFRPFTQRARENEAGGGWPRGEGKGWQRTRRGVAVEKKREREGGRKRREKKKKEKREVEKKGWKKEGKRKIERKERRRKKRGKREKAGRWWQAAGSGATIGSDAAKKGVLRRDTERTVNRTH